MDSLPPKSTSGLLGLCIIIVVLITSWYFLGLSRSDHVQTALKNAQPPSEVTIKTTEALEKALPGKLLQHDKQGLAAYVRSYWSAQEQSIVPSCVVRPENTHDVATAIRILGQHYNARGSGRLHFAVRSGGHTPTATAANVEGGIVIDLRALNSVGITEDGKFVNIGGGCRWIDVYKKLEQRGLAVAGGRAAQVGVGGLTLGGGISFFSPRTGFVCDSVLEYEIVLADGSVVTADHNSHADLWTALKGGSNNFGIVTRFKASTFPQGDIWAGYMYSNGKHLPRFLDAFHEFAKPETYDPYSNIILGSAYVGLLNMIITSPHICYTKSEKNAPALQPFMKLPRYLSRVKVRPLSDASMEVTRQSPDGERALFQTTTFENNLEMLHHSHQIFLESTKFVRPASNLIWAIVFQPLPPQLTAPSDAKNTLGIRTDKTLVNVLISVTWSKAKHDQLIHSTADWMIEKIEELAQRLDVFHPYKYLNYATANQDPMSGYGKENLRKLQQVSRKYDPEGLFQSGCVGGFKLFKGSQKYGA